MDIIVLEGLRHRGKTGALGMLYALMANTMRTQPRASAITKVAKDFKAVSGEK
ncbi:hypothetical protein FACS1894109_04620 [Spirochaetia bacterium]|nr:hypothetical protein FACS1894109_04620 [Spirochaetia bacterium]